MCAKLLRFVGLGEGNDRGVLKWELGTAASERAASSVPPWGLLGVPA